MQEYMPHLEQVYKLYGLGPNWFSCDIRLSVPDSRIAAKQPFFFDSHTPFKAEEFIKFTKESRLNQEVTREFLRRWVPAFGMNLYGIDVVIDERTGKHYIIDCNYFSSYGGFERATLSKQFDSLFEENQKMEVPNTNIKNSAQPNSARLTWAFLGVAALGTMTWLAVRGRK